MRLRAAIAGTRLSLDRDISRKPLTDMELEERAHHSTHALALATRNDTGCDFRRSEISEITPGVFSKLQSDARIL